MKTVWKYGIGVFVASGIGLILTIYLSFNAIIGSSLNYLAPKILKTDFYTQVRLNPLSGNGKLKNLKIGNPEGFKSDHALAAEAIRVKLKPSSLAGDVILVEEVIIENPQVTWEGDWKNNNLDQIQKNIESFQKQWGKQSQKDAAGTSPTRIVIQNLIIEEAIAKIRFKGNSKHGLDVKLPRLHLKNLGEKSRGLSPGHLASRIAARLVIETKRAISPSKAVVRGVSKTMEQITDRAVDLFK